ncbi:hypothetical protein ACHHYP_20694, partial [Achlya hypogyna]
FFEELPRSFEPHALHVAGGDFNVILHDLLDTVQPTCTVQASRDSLRLWLSSLGLLDAHRELHPTRRLLTGPSSINRLDYLFASSALCHDYLARADHVHGTTRSDHSACTMLLSPTIRPGCGPWRAPTWLLHTPEAKAVIVELLTKFCDNAQMDNHLHLTTADAPCQRHHERIQEIKGHIKDEMARLEDFKAEVNLHRTLVQAERYSRLHLRPPTLKPLHKPCIRAMMRRARVTS